MGGGGGGGGGKKFFFFSGGQIKTSALSMIFVLSS